MNELGTELPSDGGLNSVSLPAPTSNPTRYTPEGHIDFSGCSKTAGGWFVGGWISYPWPTYGRPTSATAAFSTGVFAERVYSTLYHREDVNGRGIGFIYFVESDCADTKTLSYLRIDFPDKPHSVYPTPQALVLDSQQLAEHLQPLLAAGEYGSHCQKMRHLLLGNPTPELVEGFIDFYGFHAIAGGWFFCGWITRAWHDAEPGRSVVASFQEADLTGEACACLFSRPELEHGAEGVVFFIRAPASFPGALCSVSADIGDVSAAVTASATALRLREGELSVRLRHAIMQADPTADRDILLGLLARRPYAGEDTLNTLDVPVFLEIDETICCGRAGLAFMGWYLAKPGDIREVRLQCGGASFPLHLQDGIRISRPDVLDALVDHGFDDAKCGFVVFVPSGIADNSIHLEVETARRAVGYKKVPRPKLSGFDAIKRLLAAADIRFSEVSSAFDKVLGPAIKGINDLRLAGRRARRVAAYGDIPSKPRFSVIVPLYGRLDFVEYQIALFSVNPAFHNVDLIYVLDDPRQQREAEFLLSSVYERFLVPFRCIMLDRNVGFAPANNIGLEYAVGEYVAYVNSDVFPGTLDWLDRLAGRLAADPTIGAIGPALLFEDGSLQHRGMYFRRLPEFGNWFFGQHHDKGMRPSAAGQGIQRCLSITGACMLMRRALAEQLGGFDEAYIIGDFEDSDLCLRLDELGLACAVDPEVHLFHLERKSQAGSGVGWRMNLTLYNAWQHERRWGKTIEMRQAV